jgi:hypothetical protein
VTVGLFKQERQAVLEATETARDGINTTLVIAGAALLLATVAIALVVIGRD